MYKEWMLLCQWEINGNSKEERFFFETEEAMIKFVKNSGNIKVEAAFKLEKLDNKIFT